MKRTAIFTLAFILVSVMGTMGDANTLQSQSGAVNVTLTGNTTVGILTNPASSNSNVTINLTVN